jgi:hypothetical protein
MLFSYNFLFFVYIFTIIRNNNDANIINLEVSYYICEIFTAR